MTNHTTPHSCPIRLSIVDNDPITVNTLRTLFSRYTIIDVVWTALSGEEALRQYYEEPPDVFLLDMSLPDIAGTEVCRRIRIADEHTPILAMTSFPLESYANDAAYTGAQGIISKTSFQQIINAVCQVAAGDLILAPSSIISSTFQTPLDSHQRLVSTETDSTLTIAEIQVLNLQMQGLLSKQIAQRLQISDSTVRTHSMHARMKLNAHTLGEALVKWYTQLHP